MDNVRCLSYAHWKARSRLPKFLLVLIELLLLDVTAMALRVIMGVDPKFHVEWVTTTSHAYSQKTKLNDLSYGIKSGQIFLPFCHNASV